MKKLLILSVGMLLSLTAYAQQDARIDWNADLDYLVRELPAKHYDFFSVRSREEFLAGIEAVRAGAATRSDLHTALKIQQLIAEFGDSHTMLDIDPLLDMNRIIPLELLWAGEGLYVVGTTPENEELLGHRIRAIGKTPITTVVDSLSTLLSIDNDAVVKSRIPRIMPLFQLLEYFGFAAGEQVELTLEQGRTCEVKLTHGKRADKVSFRPDSLSFAVENSKLFFTGRYFPNDKIYYMLYNTCRSRELESKYGDKERAEEMPSFREFEEQAFSVLEREPVGKIVFDVRYNGGGNSSQGREFAEKLAAHLKKHPGIKVYVVLGRNTFSSAILNAMDFRELTDAVFVGEETAGKPNHFGEVRSFRLPSSKLALNYSTKYFKRTDDNVNTIAPDVRIETYFSDYAKGIDPVFEWIRKQ